MALQNFVLVCLGLTCVVCKPKSPKKRKKCTNYTTILINKCL